jgi:hypothetical protein
MDLRELRDIEDVDDAGEAIARVIEDANDDGDYSKLTYLLGRLDQRGVSYMGPTARTIRELLAHLLGLAPVPRSASDYEPPTPAIAAELGVEAE